jgi:hypothetical protein
MVDTQWYAMDVSIRIIVIATRISGKKLAPAGLLY